MMLGRLFGRSKQDASKNEPQVQEEVDATEPPTDPASTHEPFIVSPTFAKEIMFDLPDRSAEDAASIVNDLALNDFSSSSPKPAVPGKRKRQEADVADGSPRKRVTNGDRTNWTRDEPPTTSTNGITGHGGRNSRASSEVVKEAPGKLPRPKTEQRKRHMAQIYPAVQKSGDIWDPAPSPKKQVEKPASHPTTTTTRPSILEATRRPRGRPPRVGSSPTEKTTSRKNGQGRQTPDAKVKPRRKGRPEGFVSPEVESGENRETPIDTFPQKTRPKARPKSSKIKSGHDHGERAPNAKSTRSSAAANGHKDVILNANTDLTKKPERDARRAAKQRKSLEQASVSTPSSARVDSLVEERTRDIALRARNGGKLARAKAQKASDEGQEGVVGDFEDSPRLQNQVVSEEHEEEEEEPEEEGRRDPEKAIDRDGHTPTQMDEGEEGGAEAEEEDSDSEGLTQVTENDEEDEEEDELELFGQDWEWKTVLEGAHSICGSKLPLNRMPKLLTETITDLINDVREVRILYEQLLPFRGIDHDSIDGLNDQLRDSIDAIEDQIRRLSEKTAATKGSEMIRDIYARAIPAMVFLLQSALAARTYYSDEPCDLKTLNEIVNGLREIIRLQKMAILLCEKATHWKAKPAPISRPIVRPTTRKMFPCLRDMRKAFSKNLVEQDRKRKMKQNAVDYSKRQKELAQSSQQAKENAARKNEILHRMIKESIEQEDERRRNERRTFRQFKEDEARARMGSHQVNGHVGSRTTWSDAEDLALYFQLEKGYAGGLTTEERYLNILNAPLLQNKLPEHIRERALYFKPFLLEERGALEWISSIE